MDIRPCPQIRERYTHESAMIVPKILVASLGIDYTPNCKIIFGAKPVLIAFADARRGGPGNARQAYWRANGDDCH